MSNWLQKQWLQYTPWHVLLIPLSWIFGIAIYIRKSLYKIGWLKSYLLSVPVVVVGNINVGGTGKTPLVIWLAEQLQLAGYKPGIISRGYGGSVRQATEVLAQSSPQLVGDEPVLIAKRTGCPMFVGADRVAAGQALLRTHPECNVIISDDGLQHYRLQRDVEIALVNSDTHFGNRLLLPAGPLREKITRLQHVDVVVDGGTADVSSAFLSNLDALPPVFNMQVRGDAFESLDESQAKQAANFFVGKNLVAIAGIGNPERFFNQLSGLGLQFDRKTFADHHAFSEQDLAQFANSTLLMTEKDAVKCQAFIMRDAWYLPVTATLSSPAKTSLIALILQKLRV